MGGPTTTERTRSPPARPARPADGGIEDSFVSSAGYYSTTTVTAPGPALGHSSNRNQPSPLGARMSSDGQAKPRNRKSARHSMTTTSTERKGSIRNAVRRLLGRRSKDDVVPDVPRIESQSSRHEYHKSDPGHSTRPQTIHAPPSEATAQRTISTPAGGAPSGGRFVLQEAPPRRNKVGSPVSVPVNAVEFPKSARLKPLDLGNPFYTRAHGPKRRATLPSLVMAEHEAARIGSFVQKPEDARAAGTSLDAARREPESEIGLAVPCSGPVDTDGRARANMDKRRSRSAGDLAQAMNNAAPFRKRIDEIEYWRQSYASVLVGPAPGHAAAVPAVPLLPEAADDDEEEPVATVREAPAAVRGPSPDRDRAAAAAAASARALSSSRSPLLRSFSRPLTAAVDDAPAKLEARVAKLEVGLVDFQRSLSNLAFSAPPASAASPSPSGTFHRQPPPSILIETLHSPSQPRFREDAGDIVEREWGSSSRASPVDRPAGPRLRPHTPSNNGTFTALYNMLAEERSARRTLEHQLRNLQHEVTRLQLSRGSWGSYNNPMARPRTPDESERGDSRQDAYNTLNSPATVVPPSSFLPAFDNPAGRIVSRFSGDSGEESEYSRHRNSRAELHHRSQTPPYEDVPPAPHEDYRIPIAHRGPYHFAEDEMF